MRPSPPNASERLSPKAISATKELASTFHKFGEDIATRMYELMFSAHPEMRHLFSLEFMRDGPSKCPILADSVRSDEDVDSDTSSLRSAPADSAQRPSLQATKLANTIMKFCTSIDSLDQFEGSVDKICKTHVMRGVEAFHYPNLQKALIQAIKEVGGPQVADQNLIAFEKTFGALSEVLIGREIQMRKALAKIAGGWEGFRPFTIVDRQDAKEGGGKMYITIESQDRAPVIKYAQGQDICVRWDDSERGLIVKRYRLSPVSKNYDPRCCYSFVVSRSLSKAAVGATDLLLEYGQIGYEIEVSPPIDLQMRVEISQNWLQRMFAKAA
uniref:Globin domain-containing protein n=1 Tax=Compsopogon caeruleus TaxID=31354 RepID=A0A6T6C583_9RHOD|mmetsp:Transcript_229/g.400  ORF Transcript_229/g.400 Transcript_229/m.400 type:complete len:327 (+) Transcript_229:1040-2020(+)|eukprot:CAMPEP_0184678862 /NCGR_PEP_ID=MMETSP0312-20130426/1676_1 /TAXON_ID=31354 /ORGANISM="Compsopogon coeruleus, Strain SAG 36.94" /LENGTH=326 /DNA_ID=CAMNT_0027127935 /DNA_START=1085 /DNA_END=2065 /DNA_ORIENTATION=+